MAWGKFVPQSFDWFIILKEKKKAIDWKITKEPCLTTRGSS